jgi:hypothetical protein
MYLFLLQYPFIGTGSQYSFSRRLPQCHKGFGGLDQTAEAASAVYIRPRKPYISNNYLDFLGDFEAIFETALAHESGPFWGIV